MHIWETFKTEIFKKKYISLVIFIAVLYFSLAVLGINYKLVAETVFGSFPLVYKLKLLFQLLTGAPNALYLLDFFLLIATAILVGVNIAVIIRILRQMKADEGIKLVVGGGSILGFVSSGCSSCGFSLLSVLGLSAVFSFLPFGNHTLYIISIGLLLFSIFYMLGKLHNFGSCKLD